MKKDRFWPFYQLSVFSGVGGFVKRKKDRFRPFYQISVFSGVGCFVKRKKDRFRPFYQISAFLVIFGHFFVENRVLDSK